ncbi:MAG: carboxypeptidase-like regulatory domain-containing protein [Planctomycetota bacterium]|nr:carboxypeptidase-like regulatory domain-containing protein [Planctomycetota bacterium]
MWFACLLALSQSSPAPSVPGPSIPTPAPAGTSTFHGRVVQAEDGAPVAHARAEVRWNRGAIHRSRSDGTPRHEIVEPPPFPSATTDDAGRFAIPYDTSLDPWIVVEAETRSPGACGLLAGHADAAHELVFTLPRAARLEIEMDVGALPIDQRWLDRVFEARASAPLYASSFPAWLGVTSGDTRRTARSTAAERLFQLDHMPAGAPIEVEFTCDGVHVGALEEELVLAAGETRRIRWTPTEPLRIGGTGSVQVDVRDTRGDPAVGATVRLERVGRRSGAAPEPVVSNEVDGRSSWPELEAGDYSLTVGGGWTAKVPTLHVNGGSTLTILTQAVPARTIRGSVRDSNGRPIAGAWVWFASSFAPDAWGHGARTDEAGAFELSGVPRGESGLLRTTHPSIADVAVVVAEEGISPPIGAVVGSIRRGEPAELRLPPTAPVHVRIVDGSGAPAAAQIRIGASATLGVTWRGVEVTETVLEAPVAALMVSAVTPDGRAAAVAVQVGADARAAVTLQLAPAGSLRLRHRGGPRLLDARVTTPGADVYGITTLVSGIDEVALIPPGDWLVRVQGQADRRVRIEAGVEALVEL